jgi:hypothetical protein
MKTTCSKCFKGFESRDASFYYNNRQKRYYTWCKECHSEIVAKRGRRKRQRQRPLSSDPVEDKFIRLRRALAQRNKKYSCPTVSTGQLLRLHAQQGGLCYYTKLRYSLTDRGPLYMSVDRVDSSVGYELGNIVLCCWFVNCAKNEWPLGQMKELWKHLPS